MAEIFSMKRCIAWDESEARKERLEGHVITAYQVYVGTDFGEDHKRLSLLDMYRNYGIVDTPTKEQAEWLRKQKLEAAYKKLGIHFGDIKTQSRHVIGIKPPKPNN